jgi:hypothetical protein
MRANHLKVSQAKIDRAKFHVEELKEELRKGSRENVDGFAFDIDFQANELIVRNKTTSDFIIHISIIAGEVVHQLRSALDHAIWQLVREGGGQPKEGFTGFPIFWDETDYKKKGTAMIKGVESSIKALIDAFQPIGPHYASSPLFQLNEFWNRDKHRLLNFIAVHSDLCQIYFLYPSGQVIADVIDLGDGPIESGAELARYPLPDGFTPDVQVTCASLSALKFADAGPFTQQLIWQVLDEFISTTENLIWRLDLA